MIIKDAVITITGARGTGKTSLAATYLPPSRVGEVFYIDSEHSSNNIRAQLQTASLDFGHYLDLSARFGNIKDDDLLTQINKGKYPWVDTASRNAMIGLYEYVLADLQANLTPGKYKVVVIDTLEKLESGMAAHVEAHKKESGVTITAYGKLWTDGVFPLYENLLSAIFARGVETIILTSHLRNVWEGTRQIAGKVEPSGKKILYRLSSLMLWLVNSSANSDGAPAALVLKERLGKIEATSDDGWNVKRQLPERLPHATWRDIQRYMVEGCDLAHPAPGEEIGAGEREMISELLSDAQVQLMILDAQKDAAEASIMPASNGATFALPQAAPVNDEDMNRLAQRETALRLIGAGKSKSEVAGELGLTLPETIRLLK